MKNRLLVMFMTVCLLLAAVGFTKIFDNSRILFLSGLQFFTLSGLYLLAVNGTFLHTREFRFAMVSVSLVITGLLFRIMHWPASLLIFLTGTITLLFLYILVYTRKVNKTIFDHLKLILLFSLLTPRLMLFFRMPLAYELFIASNLFFVLFMMGYIRKYRERIFLME